MKCPIKMLNNNIATHECDLSECAWYNTDKEQCAVVRISKELHNLDCTLDSVRSVLNEIDSSIVHHD